MDPAAVAARQVPPADVLLGLGLLVAVLLGVGLAVGVPGCCSTTPVRLAGAGRHRVARSTTRGSAAPSGSSASGQHADPDAAAGRADAVEALLADRARAVATGDRALFLATVDPAPPTSTPPRAGSSTGSPASTWPSGRTP